MNVTAASDIPGNLERAREAVAAAARAAGRNSDEVVLVAVSKRQPAELIAAAAAAGQRHFGESTTQEALPKIEQFRTAGLVWHFIGHLQSNKARFVPDNFAWLHSLDSLDLARRLSRQAQGGSLDTLIEVNVTRDPVRHGLAREAVLPFVEQLAQAALPGIRLRGLMAIGPHPATEPQLRAAFAAVRALRDDCRQRLGLSGFTELSMGMSADFVPAIAEGATMVRLGTAIFGARG
ncbi:MAG: YggS family pyridoxal phosphate-dependent enzyme [Gammaproteobacteria bacterium]|nr:YggS family pyridoxal phosphate-dependent enzyme [Gammaproteobacteria bacterium]